ncbi:RAMP superfamily protein [Lyngbya sp. CCAP 1446/10]|uniref:RAMP superfamily protein n=1 Tax=Lyngbya sp. CCAP 1446/10 TaxID=439293 RepID=UPI0022385C8B|nr:RAMP superfamily protein [Lyngbya sp. CCAP 1446/10]MCW6051355.1 RAMP superfamily protein [Lyngbya sp. CCAP 1446/10]
MVNIPDAANLVPLMFQAQAKGRSQLQYAAVQDAQECVSQWTNQTYADAPDLGESDSNKTKTYQIQWRFVTNGGQFDGIIFPALGAFGLPFYPGSSMKGAFCQACTEEQKQRYRLTKDLDEPSLLRFHGGYPVNDWTQKLVDIVHPQQDFQVKRDASHGAYALISLYRPEINFGISSQLANTNWKEVWEIWEKALGAGIGCRVSSGYGQTNKITGDVLYEVKLRGQGAASKLLDNKFEFRPNIFRASLRGHALRIFGGLNQALAENVVDELFGGIRSGKEKVGLLGMAFVPDDPEWRSADQEDAYDVTGNLIWRLSGKLEKPEDKDSLVELVKKLTQFAMLLGGFGKSWRRADHRIFYPTYTKHLIGCHWEWVNDSDNQVGSLDHAASLIQEVQEAAKKWMDKRGFEINQIAVSRSPVPPPTPVQIPRSPIPAPAPVQDNSTPRLQRPVPRPATVQDNSTPRLQIPVPRSAAQQTEAAEAEIWREAWLEGKVQVWGRTAEESLVIPWLHSSETPKNLPYQKGSSYQNQSKKSLNQSNSLAFQRSPSHQNVRPLIYRTSITGRVKDTKKSDDPTQIGRLWHRMYPVINLLSDANQSNNTTKKQKPKYLELLTIFPDGSDEFNNFLTFLQSNLQSNPKGFKRLWPK